MARRLTAQLIREMARIKVKTRSYGTIALWRIDLVGCVSFREIVKRDLASLPARRFSNSVIQHLLIFQGGATFPSDVKKWDESLLVEVATKWIKQIKPGLPKGQINLDLFKQYVIEIINDDDAKMLAAFGELAPKLLELSKRMENVRLAGDTLSSSGYGHTMNMWTPQAFAEFARKSPSEPEMTNQMLNLTRQKWFQDELLKRIRDYSVISKRIKIIEKALDAHNRRDYLVSIPLFFTQIEGILGDYLVHKGVLYSKYSKLYDNKGTEVQGIIPLINCSNSIGSASPLEPVESALKNDKLSNKRNAILHGRNYRYGNAKLSTRILLLLWVLIDVVRTN